MKNHGASTWQAFIGIVMLVSTSLWNAWPRQARALGACATCAPHASEGYEKAHN